VNWEAGLRWAFGMLGLDTFELVGLAHVVLVDRAPGRLVDGTADGVEIYLALIIVTLLLQILGIVLVHFRWYRTGGMLQIVSSAPHVVKGEGVIGIIGGVNAWKYARRSRETEPA